MTLALTAGGWTCRARLTTTRFGSEFRRRVKGPNPEAYIVGEIWDDSRRWLQGDQFDAVMNYLFTKPVLGYFCDNLDLKEMRRAGGYHSVRPLDQREFTAAIDHLLAMYDPAVTQAQLNLLDSHDTPRFITCARGDESALRLATLFMFTYPGAPSIYYGDEDRDGRAGTTRLPQGAFRGTSTTVESRPAAIL